MSRFRKGKSMEPNRTAERFGIFRHPHFEDNYIMTENATGGILNTGTKDELRDFCAEKLAASVNLSELDELIDNAVSYNGTANQSENETSCPVSEENNTAKRKDTYSISRSYGGISHDILLTPTELEAAFRVQELNYLIEDVENYLECEDNGYSLSDFDEGGIRNIALLFRDKYNDCNTPFWTGIRKAVESYARTNDIPPHFDDEETNEPDEEH